MVANGAKKDLVMHTHLPPASLPTEFYDALRRLFCGVPDARRELDNLMSHHRAEIAELATRIGTRAHREGVVSHADARDLAGMVAVLSSAAAQIEIHDEAMSRRQKARDAADAAQSAMSVAIKALEASIEFSAEMGQGDDESDIILDLFITAANRWRARG